MLVVPRDVAAGDRIQSVTIGRTNLIKYAHCTRHLVNEVQLEKNLLVFIRSGCKQITAWHHSVQATAGEAVLIRKGAYLMTEAFTGEEAEFSSLMVMIDDQFITDFLLRYESLLPIPCATESRLPFVRLKTAPVIDAALAGILPYVMMPDDVPEPLYTIKLHEILLSLATCVADANVATWLADARDDSSLPIKQFMQCNLDKHWPIERFAKEYGLSLSGFKREFVRVYGTPPRAWINSRRLNKALELVRRTDRSMTEIAMSLGYSDLAHFSTSFKQRFGQSPRQSRSDARRVRQMASRSVPN